MAKEAHFEIFRKNLKYMPRVVFDEKSKTGPGFEIGQPQRKCQRRPTLQFMVNPAVLATENWQLATGYWLVAGGC